MGVPKFFRYISERYPCLSELVKDFQIPEFDNLYLDMNGIIHMCSHPDDYDPHFRISEEKIFSDIFHYIEVLFRMIKPQRLFFMAIDGVAPRAKMNQQRGRRFRTAKEAEKLEAKAREKGEVLPEQSRFDSNCITPGTVFMANLHEQLKYFIVNKISTDPLWQQCKVILSGHETPGEGEHKVMDYIRFLRAQPGYDPNTRHCLYGLDADLIMLGLCTHEPHFSLLREEVKFGRKANSKRKNVPEAITFYLLHLSLMREYLEQEFIELKDKLPFGYNIDSVIDDWVLMGFLVGNDFIPHLPNLHIANGALPLLYSAYIKVMPTFDGYINEAGKLNLERFEKFMDALCVIDMESFTEGYADLKYFEARTGRRPNDKERTSYKPKKLEEWQPDEEEAQSSTFGGALEGGTKNPIIKKDLAALIQATQDMFSDGEDDLDSDEFSDEDALFQAEFNLHKEDYYKTKLEYAEVTPEVMRSQAECYVRAIQWNLNYYYNGVCSWSWYYPHHYAPFISDIKNFKDFKIEFEFAKPFNPYEQLLAVLPTACKNLLPTCYHRLMEDPKSPIFDYYPTEFSTDLNGKKQDWEAVVLIPFIDEKRLLEAMATCNDKLTSEEVKRNGHGPMCAYEFTDDDLGKYEAPDYYPVVKNNHAKRTDIFNEEIRVDVDKLVKGAYPGALYDVYYPGFPTMKHLKYKSSLRKGHVKVFDQPSRGENLFLEILSATREPPVAEVAAQKLLGTNVFVAWPHLVEALVVSISTKDYRYHYANIPGEYNVEENKGNVGHNWEIEKNGIIEYYRDRRGVEVGETTMLVHAKLMIGRKYTFTAQGRVTLEKQWTDSTSAYPLQTVVDNITAYNPTFKPYHNVEDIFKLNSTCFMLGLPHYGYMGTIEDSAESLKRGRMKISLTIHDEPDLLPVMKLENTLATSYMPVHEAAYLLNISRRLFSRITGSMFVIMGGKREGINEDAPRQNIGLNLKFNKKNEEIPGYTKKEQSWLYSQKAVELVQEFQDMYPKLFDFLERSSGSDIYYEYEIFPEDQGSGETVKKIVTWLKSQPYYSVERQLSGSQMLEPEVIKELEKKVDAYQESDKAVKTAKMQVKPFLLYKPGLTMGNVAPDPKAVFHLYDRVVNVRESFTVPLGHTGTVIAIHKAASGKPDEHMYDVLFDLPFAGGLSLNCAPHRGYKMSRLALINKSHGVREMEKKTGKPGQLRQKIGFNQTAYGNPQSQSQQMQQQRYMNVNQNSAFASWRQQQDYRSPSNVPNYSNYGNVNSGNNSASAATVSKPRDRDYKKPPQGQGDLFMPHFKGPTVTGNGREMPILERPATTSVAPPQHQQKATLPNHGPATSTVGKSVAIGDLFAQFSAQINIARPQLPLPGPCAPQPPQAFPPAPACFSMQLVNEYQMRGLGCPLYQYFMDPTSKFYQAQLKMPVTNEPLFGKPAPTKADASESVAEVALQKLRAMQMPPMGMPNMPMRFPRPPVQWIPNQARPNMNQPLQMQNTQVLDQQPRVAAVPQQQNVSLADMTQEEVMEMLDRELPAVLASGRFQKFAQAIAYKRPQQQRPVQPQRQPVPFVPLQAVRQQRISSTAHAPQQVKKSPNAHANANQNRERRAQQEQQPSKSENNVKSPADGKPRRERKIRIAANFPTQP